jgi:hypothetical protein
MKALRVVPAIIILISFGSLLHTAITASDTAWSLRAGIGISLGIQIAFLVYSTAWFLALILKTRVAVPLTAIALFCPPGMMIYHMIAIWFEQDNLALKLCVTLSLAVAIALYSSFFWRRWRAWQTVYSPSDLHIRK